MWSFEKDGECLRNLSAVRMTLGQTRASLSSGSLRSINATRPVSWHVEWIGSLAQRFKRGNGSVVVHPKPDFSGEREADNLA
jgi:hypothetical protein